jgi:hypothetical protein
VNIRFGYFGIIVALLSGCATSPSLQKSPPEGITAKAYSITKSEATTRTDHMNQHLNAEKSIVYFQNQGGGGAGLGLLLGPFGVAANIAMIEKVTTGDVERLKGKISIDPVEVFREGAKEANSEILEKSIPSAFQVTPILRVSKTDESTIHLTAALVVEYGSDPQKWRAKYAYQIPGSYTIDSIAQLDSKAVGNLRGETVKAFKQLVEFIARDVDSAARQEPSIQFKSAYMTPRFGYEQIGSLISDDGNMVWLRSVGGVVAVQKPQVTYVKQKG